MEFGYLWISLWVLLIIIEIFLLTLDFLALGFAAILTWIVVIIFDLWYDEWWITWLVFFVSGVINLYFFKKFLLPIIRSSIKEKSPLSADNISWEKLIVQIVNWEKVVFHEWSYWTVFSDDKLNQWDTVEVISMEWWGYRVKKVF